jgi:hypothetical protein
MKISPKVFSVPPYLSTRWEFVASLRLAEHQLYVALKDGTICVIPNLPQEAIDQIFAFHAESIETATPKDDLAAIVDGMRTGLKELVSMFTKIKGNSIGSIGRALEHDPSNSSLPDLPPEMIKKVKLLLNIIPKDDVLAMPEAESGCNCMYCQINRTLRTSILSGESGEGPDILSEGETEPVGEQELSFNEWIVEPIAEKLYKVTNKLDHNEEYRVYLGEPIGCTCGKSHCEHVLAVLRS